MSATELSLIMGKVFTKITRVEGQDESIIFETADGEKFKMYHDQDCCESVYIEDINGDLNSLLNNPIIVAEERTNSDEGTKKDNSDDSFTWTFYEIATIKGSVTIRWYGSSNGYYSESVTLSKIAG